MSKIELNIKGVVVGQDQANNDYLKGFNVSCEGNSDLYIDASFFYKMHDIRPEVLSHEEVLSFAREFIGKSIFAGRLVPVEYKVSGEVYIV